MLITLPALLAPDAVRQSRADLETARWMDGGQTAGHVAIAEALQQDFAEIGIEMTIKSIDWNVFLNERKVGNYDVARNGWIADFNDPINMLEMWTTDSGNNDAQFGR